MLVGLLSDYRTDFRISPRIVFTVGEFEKKKKKKNEFNGDRSRDSFRGGRGGKFHFRKWGKRRTANEGTNGLEKKLENLPRKKRPSSSVFLLGAWFYPPTNHENLIEGLSSKGRQFSLLYISNDVREVAHDSLQPTSFVERTWSVGPVWRSLK